MGTSPQLHTGTITVLSVVPSALHLLLITKSGETGLGLTRLRSHSQLAPALLSGGNNVGVRRVKYGFHLPGRLFTSLGFPHL